jgi:predicted ABC-type transport system involved in lysophospholipase L1 biosynthesis ATPase subunit
LLVCVLHDPEMNAHADRRLRLTNGHLKGLA